MVSLCSVAFGGNWELLFVGKAFMWKMITVYKPERLGRVHSRYVTICHLVLQTLS